MIFTFNVLILIFIMGNFFGITSKINHCLQNSTKMEIMYNFAFLDIENFSWANS